MDREKVIKGYEEFVDKYEWMSDKADTHFCPKCGQAVKWE